MYFVSGTYLLNPWNKYHETLVKCSAYKDDVQNPCSNMAGSRSRSPVLFEDLNHVLHEYHETLVKCLAHEDDVQNAFSNLAGSRSRSPVMFEDLNHVFSVRFISFKPLE
jgi:hypothetical protein